eukprot:1314116-Pleurochrysis_carterae.AAC.1
MAISALSAAVHPARLSRRACLLVLGSVWHVEARRTHPVLHMEPIGREALRTESSVEAALEVLIELCFVACSRLGTLNIYTKGNTTCYT